MSIYRYESNKNNLTENDLVNFQEVKFIDDLKKNLVNAKDLRDQWKKVADSFVKHKWIYRYIDDKQKKTLENHYGILTADNSTYNEYKKSFRYICKFMGIPHNMVIIENMTFEKDKEDKNQWEIALKYSKGLVKVIIPEGIRLIHVSPVQGIKELIPSFRSKTKGKYMYPSKRIFFTVAKDIKANQAGLEGQRTSRYTPKEKIRNAYIDPTYSEYKSGAVYIETEKPVPVENLESKLAKLFRKDKKEEEEDK